MAFRIEEVSRVRGDTKPIAKILKNDDTGLATDISGYSFLLSVDTRQNPPDTTTQQFQIAGSITDAVGGKVEFQPSVGQADQVPGVYWYDIQVTNASGDIETLVKGKWKIRQDITK